MFEGIIARFNTATNKKRKNKKEYEAAQNELALAFYTLAENIIKAFKFQLVDKDDALQEGVMICFEKLHRFDPKLGRAFNFCTTIILNHYRQLYRTAKNYNELKSKYHKYLSDKDPYFKIGNGKVKKPKNFYKDDLK